MRRRQSRDGYIAIIKTRLQYCPYPNGMQSGLCEVPLYSTTVPYVLLQPSSGRSGVLLSHLSVTVLLLAVSAAAVALPKRRPRDA